MDPARAASYCTPVQGVKGSLVTIPLVVVRDRGKRQGSLRVLEAAYGTNSARQRLAPLARRTFQWPRWAQGVSRLSRAATRLEPSELTRRSADMPRNVVDKAPP